MTPAIDYSAMLWFVCTVYISLTLVLLALRADRIWNGAWFWNAGNLFALFSVLIQLLPGYGLASSSENYGMVPASLLMLSHLLKILALSRRRARRRAVLIGGGIVAVHGLVAWAFNDLVDLNIVIGGDGLVLTLLLSWQALICYSDLRWRNRQGQRIFVGSTLVYACLTFIAALRGFSLDPNKLIQARSEVFEASFSVAAAYVLVSHLCLIAMLLDRLNQLLDASQLRQRNQARLARQARAHAAEMTLAVQQKQSLLEVLIHEVRQPLNNAQAALHDLMMTLQVQTQDHRTARQLQAIIDKVVVGLSNAMVGASVLERKTQSVLVRTDIVSVCELACSDMGPDWQGRIELTAFADLIFVQADPVLLRLAVRNLIDNAQKHGTSGHRIEVGIDRGVDLSEFLIRVINWPAAPFSVSSDLFGRGVRGSGASCEGKGLGLYIVRKIAGIHGGAVEALIDQAGRTVFQISMPLDRDSQNG